MSQPQKGTQLDAQQTAEFKLQVKQEEKKPKLFFIRRVPYRTIPRDWKRPDDKQYQKDLKAQGFITADLVKGPISDELTTDIRELDQHLLSHFWRVNQKAKFFQNRYYQYQWAFILAAFLTIALAAVNVLIYAIDQQGGWDTGTFLGTLKAQEILGFLTALVSGIAATVSFLDANQTPQKRWFKFRAQAESLRSLYFLFLARQNPFNLTEPRARVQELRRKALEIITETGGRGDQRPRITTTGSFRIPGAQSNVSESGGIHGAAVDFDIATDEDSASDSDSTPAADPPATPSTTDQD